jgi:hypothetical protein
VADRTSFSVRSKSVCRKCLYEHVVKYVLWSAYTIGRVSYYNLQSNIVRMDAGQNWFTNAVSEAERVERSRQEEQRRSARTSAPMTPFAQGGQPGPTVMSSRQGKYEEDSGIRGKRREREWEGEEREGSDVF